MDFTALLEALEHSSLAGAMKHSLWLYPIVEIAHIAGFALLVGAIATFDLRLLGFAPSTPVRALERSLLPWAWVALLVIVPTGIAMFSAHAVDFAGNLAFRVKLLLILSVRSRPGTSIRPPRARPRPRPCSRSRSGSV